MVNCFKRSFIALTSVLIFSFVSAGVAYAAYDYANDIGYLFEKGISTPDTFKEDEFLKKGEFIKWILINAGFTPDPGTVSIPYSDISSDSPYAPYIKKLLDTKIIRFNQFNDKFEPGRMISRYIALDFIFKLEGIPAPKLFNEEWFRENISDIETDSYLAPYAAKAVELGLLPRFDPKQFKPFFPLTMKHAARLLHKVQEFKSGTLGAKPANTTNTAGIPTLIIQNLGKSHELINHPKFDILLNVWDKITKEYLKKDTLNPDQLVYGAIEGLAKKVGDKYTEFQEPEVAQVFQDELKGEDLEGIGAILDLTPEGKVEVTSPLPGLPAENAGVQAKDIITQVDNETVSGLSLNDVVRRIRGPRDTNVTITVFRPSTEQTLEFTITRAVIVIATVKSEVTEDKIAIITITNFNGEAVSEFELAINDVLKAGAKKIVLDLRNNSGGYLDAGVAIAAAFLDKDKDVVKISYPDHVDITYTDKKGSLFGLPAMVLVNKGSASASEIVAGALQDHGIAKLIGETSYGKGTVQELINYIDGSSFKVTIAKWLTPLDRDISEIGLKPDVYVEASTLPNSPDVQLNRALTELRKK